MKELEFFKVLILKEEYFLAHEVLESVWWKIRKDNNNFKYVLRGLINAAVALELLKRKKSSFVVPLKAFKKYKPLYKGEFLKTAIFLEKYMGGKYGIYL